jgi:F0F1-type ATP synthase assembly protein I
VSDPTNPQPTPENQPGGPSQPDSGQQPVSGQPSEGQQPKPPQRSDVQPRRKPADQPNRWSTETEGPSETAKADALGATVLAYLITGPALFGGLGYLLDHLLGTSFLVLVGVLGGMAASLYLVWLRYGTS